MSFVSVDNRKVNLDIYNRVTGTEIKTQLATSRGLVDCTLAIIENEGRLVVDVNLWQGIRMDQNSDALAITAFCAGVMMRWEHDRYRIIGKNFRDNNDWWRELEIILANWIMQNE